MNKGVLFVASPDKKALGSSTEIFGLINEEASAMKVQLETFKSKASSPQKSPFKLGAGLLNTEKKEYLENMSLITD